MSQVCMHCKRALLRRSSRHGFAEKYLYSLAGYFPWRCSYCKGREMLRDRGDRHSDHGRLRVAKH